MTPTEYTAALTSLSLTPRDVCAWLGVSRRGEALWRENGPSNLAGRLIEVQLALRGLSRWALIDDGMEPVADGFWIPYRDIAPLLAVGEGV